MVGSFVVLNGFNFRCCLWVLGFRIVFFSVREFA